MQDTSEFKNPKVGDKVRVTTLGYAHVGTVTGNPGYTGADGRWWVQVSVVSSIDTPAWVTSFEKHTLETL